MTPLSQMIQLIVLTALALGAVYFVFYRPTVNQQNRQRRVVAGLRAGDEVVTTAGFIARVVDIREPDDGSVEILLDLGGIEVRAIPNAIADRLARPDEREPGVPAVAGESAQSSVGEETGQESEPVTVGAGPVNNTGRTRGNRGAGISS